MSIVTPLLLIISLVVSRALFSYMTSVPYHIGFMIRFVLMSDAIVGAAGDVLGAVTGVIRHVPTLFLEYVFFFRFALLVYVEAIKRLLEQLWASRISWQDLIAWLRSFVACEPPETFLFFSTFPQTRYCELYNKIYEVAPVLSRFDRILLVFLICLTCLVVILAARITFRHRIQEFVMYITTRAVRFYLTPDPLCSQFVLQPMRSFASLLGLNLYITQKSRPDERKGRDGCRVAYSAENLQVEQANFDPPDNVLFVLLTSVRMWAGLFAPLVPWFIQGKPLVRLTSVIGKFVRLMSQSKGGLLTSTGTVGDFAQASVSAHVDDTLAASVSAHVDDTLATIARTSEYDLTMLFWEPPVMCSEQLLESPQVVSFTDGNRVVGATLLEEYHCSHVRVNDCDGVFQSPEEAWDTLGIYGGDDGLTAEMLEIYVRAAQSMGQEIEVELVTKGSLGVKFLSRQYSPHIWDGDLNLCADLPRQLTKIHVSVALGLKVILVMKLLEKCRAHMLTDENTPILGEFARRVCSLHNGPIEPDPSCVQIAFWLAKYPKDVQYPNEAADWMVEYTQSVSLDANIKCFREWLLKTKSLQDMLSPPLLCEPKSVKSAVPVVVRDEISPRGVKLDRNHELRPPKPRERKAVQTAAPVRLDRKHKQPIKPIGHDKWGYSHKPTNQLVVKEVCDRPALTTAVFEEWRLRKIKAGTWKERRKPSEVASGSRPKEG